MNRNIFLQILGTVIFTVGMYINIRSDNILQSYRKSEKKGSKYVLINEFLFDYVANPNYLGEIIEWFGYFLVSQSFESFLFFFSTLNILSAAAIPRNKWNKKNIEGYPSSRKACIPFIL